RRPVAGDPLGDQVVARRGGGVQRPAGPGECARRIRQRLGGDHPPRALVDGAGGGPPARPRGAGGAPGGGGGGVSPRPRLLPRRPGGHGRRDVGDARARAGPAALRGDQSDRGPGCADRARRPPAPHPRDSGGQREGSRERPARPALASAVIGRIFSGKYEVTGYLSEGGMALVYRGRRLSDNREVAIKVLREQRSEERRVGKEG